jgi:toxin ParE1/3/4
MSVSLDFHPEVYPEVDHAHRWYETRRPGLGRDFLDAVEVVVAEITANPQRYGVIEDDVRAAPIGRLPYALYYQVLPDSVFVLGVLHTSRDPSVWQGRV